MATNIEIDAELLEAVQRAGRYRTKREAVNASLRLCLEMMLQQEAIRQFGTVEFAPGWEKKSVRRAVR